MMKIQEIKTAAKNALGWPPHSEEATFSSLRQARPGSPAMVHTPVGEAAYWMVPFVLQGMACGFAQVDLQGRVMRMGIFGGTADDRAAWIPAAYFKQPPAALLAEIEQHYPGAVAAKSAFSYDRSPAKWAWRLVVGEETAPVEVFITPRGWYTRRQGGQDGMEG